VLLRSAANGVILSEAFRPWRNAESKDPEQRALGAQVEGRE